MVPRCCGVGVWCVLRLRRRYNRAMSAGPSTSSASSANQGRGDAPTTFDRVSRVIKLIRPAVQADGGDLELVDVTPEGVVQIRFHGACVGCPSSMITLQVGIERNLKAHIPEVTKVEAVE